MAKTISAGGWKKAEINMTPLIDVLLVLIIMLMVITPLTSAGAANAYCSAAPSDSHDQKWSLGSW